MPNEPQGPAQPVSREELMQLGYLSPEMKEIIPRLIDQGWSIPEAIAAAGVLTDSRDPEQRYQHALDEYKAALEKSAQASENSRKAYQDQADMYHEMGAPLRSFFGAVQIPSKPGAVTQPPADPVRNKMEQAIAAGMKTLGEPATQFDLTRAKMREGFKSVAAPLNTDAAAQHRNEQLSAAKMLKEYIMAQDQQRANEENKRALQDMVHNLRRGLDNIAQARLHGYQLTPDSMYVVNQLNRPMGPAPAPQAELNPLPTDPNYKGP